jgi:hypothetical protein
MWRRADRLFVETARSDRRGKTDAFFEDDADRADMSRLVRIAKVGIG